MGTEAPRREDAPTTGRGHRLLAHTADWALEAWGPTRAACLEEAVLALVDCFADTSLAAAPQPVPVTLDAAPDPDLLVTLLEEVIYTTEVLGVVPVTVELADTDDGGVAGSFEAVPVEAVEITGSPPKGVSHQVTFDRDRATWRCQVLIDV